MRTRHERMYIFASAARQITQIWWLAPFGSVAVQIGGVSIKMTSRL
jgi:hypothetical protein